jgi:hypothetical protein
MIRLGAIVWLLVLGLLGVGLFQVKYEVQAREAELRQVRRQVDANVAAIRVLEAEWSYLNDLSRLNDLARRHIDLSPTTPSQIRAFSELPARIIEPRIGRGQPPLLAGAGEVYVEPATSSPEDDLIEAILADMGEAKDTDGPPAALPAGASE